MKRHIVLGATAVIGITIFATTQVILLTLAYREGQRSIRRACPPAITTKPTVHACMPVWFESTGDMAAARRRVCGR